MNQSPQQLAARLRDAVTSELPLLKNISADVAATCPGGGPGWSRKQELGHLLDSATNNRVRFVVAALEGSFVGPTYDPNGWVKINGYAQEDWQNLIELWTGLNRSLATVIQNIPAGRLDAACKVGPNAEVALHFLVDDYILHLQHHLDHLLGREQITSYPGAAVGV